MRKFFNSFLILNLLFTATISFALEPQNLYFVKKKLEAYHDSGAYEKDMASVVNKAIQYLSLRLSQPLPLGKKPAIVFDIDETALSNYPGMLKLDFGGTIAEIRQAEDEGQDPILLPTFKLYQYAKAHEVAVFFITGRFEDERSVTERNLRDAGYTAWDGLILRPLEYQHARAEVYKTAMRKKLADQGYEILLSIGDQRSDLIGGYADKTFKLPNPYYFIP